MDVAAPRSHCGCHESYSICLLYLKARISLHVGCKYSAPLLNAPLLFLNRVYREVGAPLGCSFPSANLTVAPAAGFPRGAQRGVSWWILLSALVLQILKLSLGSLEDSCKTAAMPRFHEDLQVLLGWFVEKPVVEFSESVFIASE